MMKLLLFLLLAGLVLVNACGAPPGRPASGVEAYIDGGNYYLKQGELDKAIDRFTKAIELSQNTDDHKSTEQAFVGRGIANVWTGNLEQAYWDFWEGAPEVGTSDAYAAWGVAITAEHGLDWQTEAKHRFDRAISKNPNNADAYSGRALMQLQYLHAEAYGDPIEPESYPFSILKGVVRDFEKAIVLDPEGIQGRSKRFNFSGDLAFLPKYVEANRRLGAALVGSTIVYDSYGSEEYGRVLKVYPNDIEALIGQGNAYLRQRQYDLALYDFNKAIEVAPNNPEVYLRRGVIYLSFPYLQYDLADGDFRKVIELAPNSSQAAEAQLYLTEIAVDYVRRGDDYFERARSESDYDEAAAYYAKALETDPLIKCPTPSSVYVDKIHELLSDHQYEYAMSLINKALAFEPEDDYYHLLLAEAYHQRGTQQQVFKPDEAIADLSKAIELDPTNIEHYLGRASIYEGLADIYFDELWTESGYSINNWDDVISSIRNSKTKAKVEYTKAIDNGIADCTKAIELAPKDGSSYGYRGMFYARNDDYARAIADYTRAIELGDEYSYYHRANVYKEMGDKNKALADYRKSLELIDDDIVKEICIKFIEELESD